ncbi:MAG TPA: RNA polymerase sigma factor, partial [Candidatus Acidoferrum sp.]|nr:RNA polymerase sigma factor [Candidatus Acidoferrum sp.]
DAQTDDWWDACAADGPGPLENAVERDAAQQLYRAVEQLDDGQRDVVHLHYYQSLSLQETAEALGIATSTVKYRLRNALATLQSRLAERNIHA